MYVCLDASTFPAAVSMATANSDFVVGVVSRHRPPSLSRGSLVMTPGVRLIAGADSLGQQYLTPEEAVLERGSDIIIVGRGVYEAEDVVGAARKFKERGYAAYLQSHNHTSSPHH